MSRRPRPTGALHVVTNRRPGKEREYVTHLLRRSYREGGKVKNETVGNISHLPEELVELVRAGLRGEPVGVLSDAFWIERSLPAGHVSAALAMARRLELARLLDRSPSRERDLVVAMVCQRVVAPASKLGTVRAFGQSTLADELGVLDADEDDLYAAMDWLLDRQERIEDRLARRHLKDGELVLYDVSSSYFEGRCCELAALGYSRDGKRGSRQIIYGLVCDKPGRPIAVEVFSGELHDDKTLPSQITKLKARFGLSRVVVVSDRGMVTKANIQLLDAEDVGWVTALKAPQIQKLARQGELQLSLFDQTNLGEITAEDYPGERLIVCRNPLVASERARKRAELLEATERGLAEIAQRVERGTLTGGVSEEPCKRGRKDKPCLRELTAGSIKKMLSARSEATLDPPSGERCLRGCRAVPDSMRSRWRSATSCWTRCFRARGRLRRSRARTGCWGSSRAGC